MAAVMLKIKPVFIFLITNLLVFALLTPFIIFYGPFNALKLFTVETILTSRHPQVVEFFLSKEKTDQIRKTYSGKSIAVEPVIMYSQNRMVDEINGIQIEEIEGKYFKGKVMLISNPMQVKVVVSDELGTAGQRLSELVAKDFAVAGINAGGFDDPNARGNGAFPEGITVLEGKVIHNSIGDKETNIIGFDNNGKLILSTMAAHEVASSGIKYAVSFEPNLLLEGTPQIMGDGGWGVAPRTGIGQKADGTVILVVIDGRLPGWSSGATLRDLMNVFVEYGAVNAVNLDGGSSTEMVYNGKIINRLWNVFGERYMPTAFVVMGGSIDEKN